MANKLCRAFGCTKAINRNELFCTVHFPMLHHTRYVTPIPNNREPFSPDSPDAARVRTGVADARAYIARLESKQTELRQALAAQQGEATTGTSSGGQGGYSKPGDTSTKINHL